MQILLDCVRAVPDVGGQTRLGRNRPARLDWPAVVDQADRHGVLPLLHRHVVATADRSVPPEVVSGLAEATRRITWRNAGLAIVLRRLVELLERDGVEAIPFKGPTLAAAVYGDVGLRQFTDLDLLVRERDVPRARARLVAEGFRPDRLVSAAPEGLLLARHYEYPFQRDRDGVMVELQWRVVPPHFPLPLDYTRLWARRGWVALAGGRVPGLSPEDLLIVLCVHGTKHLWRRLIWACDVGELLRRHPGLDWAYIVETCDRLGARRLLAVSLLVVDRLIGAPAPGTVMAAAAADRAAMRLAERVTTDLVDGPCREPSPLESTRFLLGVRERWRDRVAHGARLLTGISPGDLASASLPRRLWVLYYPLRAWRLAVKYGMGAMRHLPGARS